ncbi:hypothetical protein [Streptomyces sp. NPDC058572]|uniref:hypothetical protein n=1 Tax=Streptomyces sp. NPDC058572 TaxID=3346546 RepID=UPI003658C712
MTVQEVNGYAPLVVGAGLALIATWAVWWIVRYIRADTMTRASIRQAVRVRRTWKRLAPMAGLSVTDKTPTALASLSNTDGNKTPKPRVLTPVLKVKPDRFGVVVRANCLPKVSLEEFRKAAPYLADAWRCTRVSVMPDGPGQVVIRGVRVDPLLTRTEHVPTGAVPAKAATWHVGVDEYAQPVSVDLSEVPGVTVAGLPGFGKTSLINRLVCDWAPSPAIQIVGFDGKVSKAHEGDYADLVKRMFAFVGDDLEAANTLFNRLVGLRRARCSSIRAVLGVKSMWDVGPSAAWPLVVVIIDEAHTYFRDYKGSDPETKKLARLSAENARLVEDLVKKGRSVGMLVILATQKSTGDAIPTFIRDVCPVGLSFAQKTAEAAVAALGEDIRNWDDANPINLQDPAYVGVASMSHQSRPGFARIRTPYVADTDAARIADATAHLTRDPMDLLIAQTGRACPRLTTCPIPSATNPKRPDPNTPETSNYLEGGESSMSEDRITQRTVTAVMAVIAALAFVFSFGNVWNLALRLGVPAPIAPLIAPMVDLSVLGLLVALRHLSLRGVTPEEMTAATRLMHFSGLLTLALNIAEPLTTRHYGRAAVDAVAPLLLLGWGTVGPQLLRAFHTVTRAGTAPTPAATGTLQGPVPPGVGREPVPEPAPDGDCGEPVAEPAPVVRIRGPVVLPDAVTVPDPDPTATVATPVPAMKIPHPLLTEARSIAASHHTEHGKPITAAQLKLRLCIGLPMATALHAAL